MSIEIIAITSYFICRTWASRYDSVLASLLALALHEPIQLGMWYGAFAFAAIWLCGLVAIQMIRKPKWYSWLLLTGLMTFIIYTHSLKMVSVVSLLLGASIYLMLFQRNRASFWIVVSFGAAVMTL